MSETSHIDKKICLWVVYISTNFDVLFFFIFLLEFFLCSMPTYSVWLLLFTRYKRAKKKTFPFEFLLFKSDLDSFVSLDSQ